MVEELAHLVDLDGAFEARLLQREREVLAVLAAARVRGVRARGDREHLREATLVRLGQRVAQVRVPVAVAPEHGKVDAAGCELGFERRLQLAVLVVDRAHAAEVAVVVGDLFEALLGDAATTGDVAQERDDVVLALGPAETGEEDRVVRDRFGDVLRAGGRRIRRTENARQRFRHCRTSTSSAAVIRRPVKNGTSSRTCRRASVCAQVAHEVDEVDELVRLERKDPLVVAERERGDGVGDDRAERGALAAVLGEHPAALLLGQQVPVVAAHERVDGQPFLRLDAAQEAGHVRFVELGVAVHAHRVPGREERLQEPGAPQLAEGPLQRLRVGAVEPDHDVGVGAEAGDVVEPACDDALEFDVGDDAVELLHGTRAHRCRRGRRDGRGRDAALPRG